MAVKKQNETRQMTMEMITAYHQALKMDAYAEACKARLFVRTKTVADAILASSLTYNALWKAVMRTWPETKTATCTLRKDETVQIEWEK
jgi:hypothetical protein